MLTSLRPPRPRPADLTPVPAAPEVTLVSGEGQAQARATTHADFNSRKMMVLGIYGADDDLRALLRLPDGSVHVIARGTRVGAQTVVAIDAANVVLSGKGGVRRLDIPS